MAGLEDVNPFGGGATVRALTNVTGTTAITSAWVTDVGKAAIINPVHHVPAAGNEFQGLTLPDATALNEGAVIYFGGSAAITGLRIRTNSSGELVTTGYGDLGGHYLTLLDNSDADGIWSVTGQNFSFTMQPSGDVSIDLNFGTSLALNSTATFTWQKTSFAIFSDAVLFLQLHTSSRILQGRLCTITNGKVDLSTGSWQDIANSNGTADGDLTSNDAMDINQLFVTVLSDTSFVVWTENTTDSVPVFISCTRSGLTITAADPDEITTGDAANIVANVTTLGVQRIDADEFLVYWWNTDVYALHGTTGITWGSQQQIGNSNGTITYPYLMEMPDSADAYIAVDLLTVGASGDDTLEDVLIFTESAGTLTEVDGVAGLNAAQNHILPVWGDYYTDLFFNTSGANWYTFTADETGLKKIISYQSISVATTNGSGNTANISGTHGNAANTGFNQHILNNDVGIYISSNGLDNFTISSLLKAVKGSDSSVRSAQLALLPSFGSYVIGGSLQYAWDKENLRSNKRSTFAMMRAESSAPGVAIQLYDIPVGRFG